MWLQFLVSGCSGAQDGGRSTGCIRIRTRHFQCVFNARSKRFQDDMIWYGESPGDEASAGHLWPAVWDGRTSLTNRPAQFNPWERFWVPSLLWGKSRKLKLSNFNLRHFQLRWCRHRVESSSAAMGISSVSSANRGRRFDPVPHAGWTLGAFWSMICNTLDPLFCSDLGFDLWDITPLILILLRPRFWSMRCNTPDPYSTPT